MTAQLLIAFVIYLSIIAGISFFVSKTGKSGQFALGGRSTNYWVTAIALQASDTSHWLFLAFPGAVYVRGSSELFVPFFLVSCMFLNWQFIAPRLRRLTALYKTVTLFSFFEKHFKDSTGQIRIISAAIALIFFFFFIASGFVASGQLFEFSFNMSYQSGVLIGLAAATIYVLFGGYRSVAWTNFFQGMFLLLVLIFVPTYGYFVVGGWKSIVSAAHARNLPIFTFPELSTLKNALLIALGWGLGYFGQPHLLNFFMGIKDPKNIKYAKFIGGVWQSLALMSSFFIGLVGIAYFSNGIPNPETTFIAMTTQLFCPLLTGFMLCALLAATLTTLNSQILAASSILAQDLYKKIIGQNATPATMYWMTRLSVIVVAFFSAAISLYNAFSIYDLVAYAWSGIGSSFSPLVIASLYWKGANRHGALASIIAGATTVALWPFFNIDLFPMIPGFFVSATTLYIVSRATSKTTANER